MGSSADWLQRLSEKEKSYFDLIENLLKYAGYPRYLKLLDERFSERSKHE